MNYNEFNIFMKTNDVVNINLAKKIAMADKTKFVRVYD